MTDRELRRRVHRTLSDRGFEVLEADDVARARELLASRSPDLLVVEGSFGQGSELDFVAFSRGAGYAGPVLVVSEIWPDGPALRRFTDAWSVARVLIKPITEAQLRVEMAAAIGDATAPLFAMRSNPEAAPLTVQQPGSGNDDLDREMADLRRGYADQFPGLLDDARRAVAEAREGGGDKGGIEEAERLAHTLAGTTGVLGFRATSESLRAIEVGLAEFASDVGGAPGGAWDALDATLRHVGATFDGEWAALKSSDVGPEEESADPDAAEARRFTACILVVDDDPDTLRSLELVGRRHMIRVLTARTGDEALERAGAERIDGAVLDIYLEAGESGYDVARRLREQPGLCDLPIGFFSRDSSTTSRVKAAHAGGSLFLDKRDCGDEFPEAVRYLVSMGCQERRKVLLLTDDASASVQLLVALEARGLDVSVTTDAGSILREIFEVSPAALLVRSRLEPVSGFDVCKMVRTTTAWKDLPVVLLTDSDGREVRRACFDSGADDHVSLPADVGELVARMDVLMERVLVQRDRADRDDLTGLFTRRAFYRACNARLGEAQRKGTQLSLCVLDLDRFKQLNDGYGHEGGDRVLVGLGSLLGARFRAYDVRGRWGGEEFAVLLCNESAPVAGRVLQRVLEEFRAMEFEAPDGRRFTASFSGGIACRPDDGEDLATLFRRADARLYRVKETGRGRIEWGDG